MSVEYLDLADFIALAAEVTGLSIDSVMHVADLGLADSALHAPAAGFEDTDLYPDFVDKAAILVVRLAKNRPLPDGNKRAAWVSLRLFVELNGWTWEPKPTVDDAEQAMLAIAAGDWDELAAAQWLQTHLVQPADVETYLTSTGKRLTDADIEDMADEAAGDITIDPSSRPRRA